jgi:hypothetical protein
VQCLNGQIGAVMPLRWNFLVQGEQIGSRHSGDFAGRPTFDHLAEVLTKSNERHACAAFVVYNFNSVSDGVQAKNGCYAVGGSYRISATPAQILKGSPHRAAEVIVYVSLHEPIILARRMT